MTVTANDTCAANGASYSRAAGASGVIRADGTNAVINLTGGNVDVINTSTANAAYGLDARNRGQINAAGNMTITTNGLNGRSVIAQANSSIQIAGHLVTRNLTSHSGAGVQIDPGSQLTVNGTTTTTTRDADGFRVFGAATFGDDVTM